MLFATPRKPTCAAYAKKSKKSPENASNSGEKYSVLCYNACSGVADICDTETRVKRPCVRWETISMKKIFRTAALLMAPLLLFTTVAPGVSAEAAEPARPELRFRADGTFTILQITDTQDTDQLHIGTAQFIEAALDEVQPDLVVYTGDNHAGWWLNQTKRKMRAAIDAIVGPVAARGIPFATVPGNHDGESIKAGITLEDQLDMFMAYPTCLSVDDGDLTGCSTYNLLVKNAAGTKDVFNIYMVDSGGFKLFNAPDQDLIAPDQVAWYRDKSDELRALNGGTPMPSMLFQHIPVPEFYYELMTPVAADTPDAIEGKGEAAGQFYLPDADKHIAGTLGERPCVAAKGMGFYDAWAQKGDVFAAFFGHDHNNDYVGKTADGIVMGYSRGTGFHAYGQGTSRGVRAFTLYEDDVRDFETRSILYSDIVSTVMPEMPTYLPIPWHEHYNFLPDLFLFGAWLVGLAQKIVGIVSLL